MQASLTAPLLVVAQTPPPARRTETAPAIPLFPGAEVFFPDLGFFGTTQVVALDPAKVSFQLYDNKNNNDFMMLCAAGARPQMLFNGNLFTPEGKILGLLVSGGQRYARLTTGSKLLSGIFYITKDKKANIVFREQFNQDDLGNIDFAMQAGPLIIEPGRKKGIYESNFNFRPRTIIAREKNGRILVMTFTAWKNLWQIQNNILENFPDVDSAINLDGGGSTASCLNTAKYKNLIDPSDDLPFMIMVRPPR